MKSYIDTEFINHKKQPKFLGFKVGKPIHTTELISIGIVCEDGRQYYAICNEFDVDAAWQEQWVRYNVLQPLHAEMCPRQGSYAKTHHWELFEPFQPKSIKWMLKFTGQEQYGIKQGILKFLNDDPSPEFYGYCADYDWVVFCQLFGRMVDLPEGFPYYCRDLKQMMDERELSKEWKDEICPDPVGQHNALVDARWNMKLHQSIAAYDAGYINL